jgi:hypothetical protein
MHCHHTPCNHVASHAPHFSTCVLMLLRALRACPPARAPPSRTRTSVRAAAALSPYSSDRPPFYVPGPSLDRAVEVRVDDATLRAYRNDPAARALLVTRGRKAQSLVAQTPVRQSFGLQPESSKASSPHRPRERTSAHLKATQRTNLASAFGCAAVFQTLVLRHFLIAVGTWAVAGRGRGRGHGRAAAARVRGGTAVKRKLRIVILGFCTARQKMVLEL